VYAGYLASALLVASGLAISAFAGYIHLLFTRIMGMVRPKICKAEGGARSSSACEVLCCWKLFNDRSSRTLRLWS